MTEADLLRVQLRATQRALSEETRKNRILRNRLDMLIKANLIVRKPSRKGDQ